MSQLGLTRSTRVIFFVHDMEPALAFYEGILGLTQAYPGGGGWAEFQTGNGCSLCLHDQRAGDAPTTKIAIFGWAVEDLDRAVAALRAAGVAVEDPEVVTEGLRAASFLDPSGNGLFFEGP